MPPLYRYDPFLAIQHALQSRFLDLPMSIVTTACEGWALAIIGLIFLIEMERRAGASRSGNSERAGSGGGSGPAGNSLWAVRDGLKTWLPYGMALIVVGLVVHWLKVFCDTPRPLDVLGADQVHVLLEPLHRMAFPSGHSASVALLASYACALHGRKAAWLWVFALLGGLSRIYVGAHWTLDVCGGLAVGTLAGLALGRAIRSLGLPASARPTPAVAGTGKPAEGAPPRLP